MRYLDGHGAGGGGRPRVHALVNAEVIVEAGKAPRKLSVVIRDGLIEAVGHELDPPADARIWDLSGHVVYPGLIDPYVETGTLNGKAKAKAEDEEKPEESESSRVSPEIALGGSYEEPDGFHPERRAADHISASAKVVRKLRGQGFTVVGVASDEGLLRGSMSVLALGDGALEQRLLVRDGAQLVQLVNRGWRSGPYPNSLMGVIAVTRQALYDARWYAESRSLYAADPVGRERPPLDSQLEALEPASRGDQVILFGGSGALLADRVRRLSEEFDLSSWMLGTGREYQRLDVVQQAGVPVIAPVAFPKVPQPFDDDAWLDVSLDELRHWERAPSNPRWLLDAGIEISLTGHGLAKPEQFSKMLRKALATGLTSDEALAALTTAPARMLGLADRLGSLEPGKVANIGVSDGELFAKDTRVVAVFVDGEPYEIPEPLDASDKSKAASEDAEADQGPEGAPAEPPPPEGGPLATPDSVFVRGATIWTSGPAGTLENADMLIESGRIVEVGSGLRAPRRAHVIDGTGRHVTAGLVDAHSHTAVDGGVNEGTLSVTSMVRIGDAIDSQSRHIYRQLAGGLTTAHVMHGSANAIGGQNVVLKLRWGAAPRELVFEEAPATIKFALGENPKQSNWGDDFTKRYPQTRMGVAETIRGAFQEALDYRRRHEEHAAGKHPMRLPPRRNLRHDALMEVLDGERLVHSHSYRQDEILMLMRVAESYDFRIAVFQHVLEGYKVADEMARHGAGASTFSDWWAYKFEVYDAIPLQRHHHVGCGESWSRSTRTAPSSPAGSTPGGGEGSQVSEELPEVEALKFVTLNPARQLRVDHKIGSLEPGKDADFVVWSGSPLDSSSMALETWVEGKLYFDREIDLVDREAPIAERERLVAKARSAAGKLVSTPPSSSEEDSR